MWFSKPSWFGSNCENDIEDDIGVSEGSKVILDNNDACQDTSSLFKTMMGKTISRKVSIFNRGLIAFVLLNKLFISNTLLYYKLNCAIMVNWIICSILYNLPLKCISGHPTCHFFSFQSSNILERNRLRRILSHCGQNLPGWLIHLAGFY